MSSDHQRRSILERVLNLFTDVRRGEGLLVVLMMLNVFFLLFSYYVIKPVREGLILGGAGAEIKQYASFGQSLLLLLFAIPLYSFLASRLKRRVLINAVSIFFTICLVVFYVLARIQGPTPSEWLGIAFFLWVGIFNLMVVAQFWSFANDVYSIEEGKRLFVIFVVGQNLGAVLGSFFVDRMVPIIGEDPLLLFAAGLLLSSIAITNFVDHRRKKTTDSKQSEPQEEKIASKGAFKVVFQSKYLLLIAFFILIVNLINTTGEFILGKSVENLAQEVVGSSSIELTKSAFITKFYGGFFGIVNLLSFFFQLFLVSRLLKWIGVRGTLFVLPVVAFGSYSLMALIPIMAAIRWGKTAENSVDYSLMNTLRGVLFLPTSRTEKYKAKQAIDTLFVRIGDALSALLVFLGANYLLFSLRHYAMVNAVLALVALGMAYWIGREYDARVPEDQDPTEAI